MNYIGRMKITVLGINVSGLLTTHGKTKKSGRRGKIHLLPPIGDFNGG
jgi:hypothetical protein